MDNELLEGCSLAVDERSYVHRHCLALKNFSPDILDCVTKIAVAVKARYKRKEPCRILEGYDMINMFEKGSTRTRLSYEAGENQLGAHGIFVSKGNTQFALTDECIEAKAVLRYCDHFTYRAMTAAKVITFAKADTKPVTDACSEKYHPAQSLTDYVTMVEHRRDCIKRLKVVWMGIEDNVSNTLKIVCAIAGWDFVICGPKDERFQAHGPSVDVELNQIAEEWATQNGGSITRTSDVAEAMKDADFVHTDTWMDMEFFDKDGVIKPEFEEVFELRKQHLAPYKITKKLIDDYPQVQVMHCMPCHTNHGGYEIELEAVQHERSIILDQAENRMHMQKAMMLWQLHKEDHPWVTEAIEMWEKDPERVPKKL